MFRLENKMDIYFAILLVVLLFSLGANCLILANTNGLIKTIEEKEEAWDEASIVVDGKEVIRGQIDYYYTDDNNETTLYFSDGNVWTTNVNNALIQHHNN